MRIGIIGAGYITKLHTKAIKAAGYELVIVADPNKKLAEEFGTAHNVAWTADTADLLKQKLDLVTIAVPNNYHFEVAKTVLASGHAILCEKPLTRNAAQSHELIKLVKQSGKPFFVGYMKRSHPAIIRFVEMAKRVGTMRSGLVRVFHPFTNNVWQSVAKGIAEKPSVARDGALTNAGSHYLDLLLHAAGPVKRVIGSRIQYRPDCPQVDTAAHALLEMQNGATITVECGWLPLTGIGPRDNGWDEILELRGDEGFARLIGNWWDRPDIEPSIADLWHEPSRTRETFNPGAVDYFMTEYQMIADALAGKPTPLATAEQATKVDELLDEIYAKADQAR
ncbi:Gfo/Idh/MocA family oxidoreductase [soil metagenome]